MLPKLGIEIPQRIFAGVSWQAPRIKPTISHEPRNEFRGMTTDGRRHNMPLIVYHDLQLERLSIALYLNTNDVI